MPFPFAQTSHGRQMEVGLLVTSLQQWFFDPGLSGNWNYVGSVPSVRSLFDFSLNRLLQSLTLLPISWRISLTSLRTDRWQLIQGAVLFLRSVFLVFSIVFSILLSYWKGFQKAWWMSFTRALLTFISQFDSSQKRSKTVHSDAGIYD